MQSKNFYLQQKINAVLLFILSSESMVSIQLHIYNFARDSIDVSLPKIESKISPARMARTERRVSLSCKVNLLAPAII